MSKTTNPMDKLVQAADEMANPAVTMHRHIANLLQLATDLTVIRRKLVKADLGTMARKVVGL